jgi:hypothetical protein
MSLNRSHHVVVLSQRREMIMARVTQLGYLGLSVRDLNQ